MTDTSKRALIVGAGIAGLAAALRLHQIGWRSLILERAPARRDGGYVLNFFGIGYDAAERMGVLPALKERHNGAPELDYVKPDGSHRFTVPKSTVEDMFGDRNLTLLRGDIEAVLYEAVSEAVDIRFGTSIASIDQDGRGVHVTTTAGDTEHADLLIGADGLHSKVRETVFGDEERFRLDLGNMVAAFAMDQLPAGLREGVTTTLTATGRTVAVTDLTAGRSAAFFAYGTPDPAVELAKGADRAITDRFGDLDWVVPDLLAGFHRSESAYFDSVSQVLIDRWSEGRVVLLGDAAWCVTLFAGYGASLAVGGADLLAAELAAQEDDVAGALRSWEDRLRPDVEARQKLGRRNTAAHAPGNRFQLAMRNLVMRSASLPITKRLLRRHLQLHT